MFKKEALFELHFKITSISALMSDQTKLNQTKIHVKQSFTMQAEKECALLSLVS